MFIMSVIRKPVDCVWALVCQVWQTGCRCLPGVGVLLLLLLMGVVGTARIFAQSSASPGPSTKQSAVPAGAAAIKPSAALDVLQIFQLRCVACHGPQLEHPKEKFGYITDLPRLKANPEMIVPGDPEESEIYLQVDEGTMPPPKSKWARLSPVEIRVIHDWIAAGAPIPKDWANDITSTASATSSHSAAAAKPPVWFKLGNLHPLAIHFPMGLLVGAFLFECLGMICTSASSVRQAVRYCLRLGCLGAVGAAITGWIMAYSFNLHGDDAIMLTRHRWLGVGVAVLSALLVILEAKTQHKRRWFRGGLLLMVILLMAGGHLGGSLVWGADFWSN